MLQISPTAARLISTQCQMRNVGEEGGMRVFAKPGDEERRGLRLRYVTSPEPGDEVLEHEDARVFLAEEVVPVVAPLLLDAVASEDDEGADRLILRSGAGKEQ